MNLVGIVVPAPRERGRAIVGEFSFLQSIPRFVFFTGKGGVGKTSLACATATRLADSGQQVLLVSTDPASNVGQVFGQVIGNRITSLGAVKGLDAIEIDPEQAADIYRERVISPMRGVAPAADIAAMAESLSGSCTTEVASFNEFTDLLAADALIGAYDHVVFDTAPTGHTIRLLQLPGEWTTFLEFGREASCLGPMAGMEKARDRYASALARLADPTVTRLVLVARAQPSALSEAARTAGGLADLGITEQHLVVNAVLPDPGVEGAPDPLASVVFAREQKALAALPVALQPLPMAQVSLRPSAVMGVEAVRSMLYPTPVPMASLESGGAAFDVDLPDMPDLPELASLVGELAHQNHGLVLCMGKGGVGKTSIAAAIALALVEAGKKVHLSTTDPAAHLDDVLAGATDDRLTVSRIDAHAATEAYRARCFCSTRPAPTTGR